MPNRLACAQLRAFAPVATRARAAIAVAVFVNIAGGASSTEERMKLILPTIHFSSLLYTPLSSADAGAINVHAAPSHRSHCADLAGAGSEEANVGRGRESFYLKIRRIRGNDFVAIFFLYGLILACSAAGCERGRLSATAGVDTRDVAEATVLGRGERPVERGSEHAARWCLGEATFAEPKAS